MSEQQYSHKPSDADSASEADDIWRKEIHAHVDRYRTRRGRRVEGAYSMRFPFPSPSEPDPDNNASLPVTVGGTPVVEHREAAVHNLEIAEAFTVAIQDSSMSDFAQQQVAAAVQALEAAEASSVSDAPSRAAEVDNAPDGPSPFQQPAVSMTPAPRSRSRRKVIAFPRQLMATPDVAYRLADPVMPEQPRILDVPEELEAVTATPFLDGLMFEGKSERPVGPDQVELPFRPIRASQRCYAILVDAALVAAGSAVFGAVAYKLMPNVVFSKPVLATAAGVPVLFWFVYQFLLLVYGGTTPGMRLAKVRLLTFKGKAPNMRQRRNRAIGLCLSTASVAMGLLWAFVDVDALCWHDRMSQTYMTGP